MVSLTNDGLLAIHCHDCFVKLLLATCELRFANSLAVFVGFFEGHLAFFKLLAQTAVERSLAFGKHLLVRRFFEQAGSVFKGASHGIHTADVSQEDVVEVG